MPSTRGVVLGWLKPDTDATSNAGVNGGFVNYIIGFLRPPPLCTRLQGFTKFSNDRTACNSNINTPPSAPINLYARITGTNYASLFSLFPPWYHPLLNRSNLVASNVNGVHQLMCTNPPRSDLNYTEHPHGRIIRAGGIVQSDGNSNPSYEYEWNNNGIPLDPLVFYGTSGIPSIPAQGQEILAAINGDIADSANVSNWPNQPNMSGPTLVPHRLGYNFLYTLAQESFGIYFLDPWKYMNNSPGFEIQMPSWVPYTRIPAECGPCRITRLPVVAHYEIMIGVACVYRSEAIGTGRGFFENGFYQAVRQHSFNTTLFLPVSSYSHNPLSISGLLDESVQPFPRFSGAYDRFTCTFSQVHGGGNFGYNRSRFLQRPFGGSFEVFE